MEEIDAQIYHRKFPRRHFGRSVGVLSGGKYFMTTGFEIGEGGLSFRSEKVIRTGALVVLNFQLPEGEFVSVRAEIRNSEMLVDARAGEVVYGCSFENLVFERKREIRNFVTNRTDGRL